MLLITSVYPVLSSITSTPWQPRGTCAAPVTTSTMIAMATPTARRHLLCCCPRRWVGQYRRVVLPWLTLLRFRLLCPITVSFSTESLRTVEELPSCVLVSSTMTVCALHPHARHGSPIRTIGCRYGGVPYHDGYSRGLS